MYLHKQKWLLSSIFSVAKNDSLQIVTNPKKVHCCVHNKIQQLFINSYYSDRSIPNKFYNCTTSNVRLTCTFRPPSAAFFSNWMVSGHWPLSSRRRPPMDTIKCKLINSQSATKSFSPVSCSLWEGSYRRSPGTSQCWRRSCCSQAASRDTGWQPHTRHSTPPSLHLWRLQDKTQLCILQ